MSEDIALRLLAGALPQLEASFRDLPQQAEPAPAIDAMAAVMSQVAERMADNYPYFHPLYAGQMLKPPHPLARAAYALAMAINPNNHALDGGRASSRMEVEAVREIARMFGWTDHLGHLTSGGTFANLEGLWIAGQLAPGKRIVASEQAHYTHGRISAVLGLPFASRACRPCGPHGPGGARVHAPRGRRRHGGGDAGHDRHRSRRSAASSARAARALIHSAFTSMQPTADTFKLVSTLGEEAARAFACVAQADSIVVDPHKHGLQPYGCGCILFRDPAVGRFYKHDSPYTYFTSNDLHLGEISLECSRAGASAVALWATQQLLPLITDGEFANGLRCSREAAVLLHKKICADGRFLSPFPPELDILVWAVRASHRRDIVPPGATNLHRRRARRSSPRAGPTTQQIFSFRLVGRPGPAKQRYLPAFRTHEAGTPGLARRNLEQIEPGDGRSAGDAHHRPCRCNRG